MEWRYNNGIRREKNSEFLCYLKTSVLSQEALDLLAEIEKLTDIVLFSGVIRDYALKRQVNVRDVDFTLKSSIVGDVFIQSALESREHRLNSFGGYKFSAGALVMDMWPMDRTWGIMRQQQEASIENLVKSAFFNFSAVAYSFEHEEFYIHEAFDGFLKNREIDIVYEENPNVPLCILNSMYYSDLLKMRISSRLRDWLLFHYSKSLNFHDAQISHWGKVLFDDDTIRRFVHGESKNEEKRRMFNYDERPSRMLQLCLF